MDSLVDSEIHDGLKWMIHFTPILIKMFNVDVIITISDKEKVLHQDYSPNASEKLRLPIGYKLQDTDVMNVAMKKNQVIHTELPKEVLGVAQRAFTAPIYDLDGNIIGSIGIGLSIENKAKMIGIAEQFVSASQEISAATEELISSSDEFTTYMENLSNAQDSMLQQVNNTNAILDMINGIAKNTRILGFNAGIEAARSGEHGRGFSVVAKEITKLADQSADSVKNIQNLIRDLKDKVEGVAKIVQNAFEISKEQHQSTKEISNAIQQLVRASEDLEEISKHV